MTQATVVVLFLLPETLQRLEPSLRDWLEGPIRCVVTVLWRLVGLDGCMREGYYVYRPASVDADGVG